MDLAEACGFGAVLGHHYGLFDFNTIDPGPARRRIAARPGLPPFLLAELGLRYELQPGPPRRARTGPAPGGRHEA
jgi:hypothetical protein